MAQIPSLSLFHQLRGKSLRESPPSLKVFSYTKVKYAKKIFHIIVKIISGLRRDRRSRCLLRHCMLTPPPRRDPALVAYNTPRCKKECTTNHTHLQPARWKIRQHLPCTKGHPQQAIHITKYIISNTHGSI